MIGFNALGQMGRLGNQMFQYASLRGIASNNGYEICIPPPKMQIDEWRDHALFHTFEMNNLNSLNLQYIDGDRPVVQVDFAFDEEVYNNCPDWITLFGFFQSEKYFKDIRQDLLKDFTFKSNYMDPAKEYFKNLDNPISLHIRRTDYITNPNHTALDISYYKKALKKFDSDRQVLIFSDDPEWCMSRKMFSDDRFLVSETKNAQVDMAMMSLCKDHIIANSSFSWWAAWLSDANKVIAPKDEDWFKGSNNAHLDTSDIIPDSWEKI